MKTVQIEQTDLQNCVSQAQQERLLVTQDGQPVALVIGVDKEQLELGQDAAFWQLIAERRSQKSLRREELQKSWPEE